MDLRQAAIGPGMAVFSRFARVIEPDGSSMRVRTALGLINQVLDEVLDEQEEDFDAETRWAIHWFSQFYVDEGPYGVAEQLAVSMNVAVPKMVDAGIIEAGRGKVRLLGRDELPAAWDPRVDRQTPVWEATQHLVKRLESSGERSAARLLRQLDGLGTPAQLLAYRLYTVCENTRPALAGPYNALVVSWPEVHASQKRRRRLAPATSSRTWGADPVASDLSNKARVGEAFDVLAQGLEPFVDRHMSLTVRKGERWVDLYVRSKKAPNREYSTSDPSFLLNVMIDSWEGVFDRRLPRSTRYLLFTLRDKRNEWAHNRAIQPHDAQFTLSGIVTLLDAVDANETDRVRVSLDELNRSLFVKERERAAENGNKSSVLTVPQAGLRPWREVIQRGSASCSPSGCNE